MRNREGLLIISGNKRNKEKLIKVSSRGFKKDQRKDFLIQCVIKLWNSYPQNIKEAKGLNQLEDKLDKFMQDRFVCS